MFPEDIAVLFAMLPTGTPVNIVDQPVKFGWHQGQLFVEAHEPLAQVLPDGAEAVAGVVVADPVTAVADAEPPVPADGERALADAPDSALTAMTRAFVAATARRDAEADWAVMEAEVEAARGLPVAVGIAAAPTTPLAAGAR